MRFKTFRILLLLMVLAMVAHHQFSAKARFADWDAPVFVAVYPVNADGSQQVERYIDRLSESEFAAMIAFAEREARRHGLGLGRPFYLEIGRPVTQTPPAPPVGGSWFERAAWILKARWWRFRFDDQGLDPDIVVLARYHDPDRNPLLPHSTGIEDVRLAIANLFATRAMRDQNNVVLLHEMLHTLGASDKYDLSNGQPLYPAGYVEPALVPLHPQRYAELMAGRIAISEYRAEQVSDFAQVRIGPITASEIGWIDDASLGAAGP